MSTPQLPVSNGWCPFAVKHLLPNHYGPGSGLVVRNTIVDHATEGTTAAGAIATFENSVPPNRVSAHFVIDRDGIITQLVSIHNTAFHASQCNHYSVGIEHVALSLNGARALNKQYAARIAAGKQTPWDYMPATDVQYASSARLHKWICDTLGLLVDRNHIRTHNEASPRDGHVECCTGAVDIDRIVRMTQDLIRPETEKAPT